MHWIDEIMTFKLRKINQSVLQENAIMGAPLIRQLCIVLKTLFNVKFYTKIIVVPMLFYMETDIQNICWFTFLAPLKAIYYFKIDILMHVLYKSNYKTAPQFIPLPLQSISSHRILKYIYPKLCYKRKRNRITVIRCY